MRALCPSLSPTWPQAVGLWRCGTHHLPDAGAAGGNSGSNDAGRPETAAAAATAAASPSKGRRGGGKGSGQAEAAPPDSPAQQQRYVAALRPFLFQSLPLLAGHYFQREALQGAAQGAPVPPVASCRLLLLLLGWLWMAMPTRLLL